MGTQVEQAEFSRAATRKGGLKEMQQLIEVLPPDNGPLGRKMIIRPASDDFFKPDAPSF